MKTVSDWINKTTGVKRSQAHRDRCNYAAKHDEPTANRVRWCGSFVRFREWLEGGEQRILSANLCKKAFLCPICAARRAGKQHQAYAPKIEKLLAEDGELKLVMVTLTIKAGPDLHRQFCHLQGSLRKAAASVRKGRSKSCHDLGPSEFMKFLGQLRSIEIKRSAGDPENWHVHVHILVLIREWIDVERLSVQWLGFTGDSYIVDVREVQAKEGDPESDPLHAALCEVLKYPLKFVELSDGDAWHCHETLKGRRLTDATGILRGVQVGALDEDEIGPELVGPYRDYVAMWMAESQSYQIRQVEEMSLPAKPNNRIESP